MSLWPIRVYVISTSCWFLFGQNYSAFRTLTCRPYTLLYFKLCLPDFNLIYFFQTIYKWTMSQIKLVRTDSQLSQMSRASESMCADDILGTIYLCIYIYGLLNLCHTMRSCYCVYFLVLRSVSPLLRPHYYILID